MSEVDTSPGSSPGGALTLPVGGLSPPAPGGARPRPGSRGRRLREAAAARSELAKRFGTAEPGCEAPLGFRFTLDGVERSALGPRQLLSRCVQVRPYVREVFALGVAAAGGSWRSERGFQVSGTEALGIRAVLDLIPPEIAYTREAWIARNRWSARQDKLADELVKLDCESPSLYVDEHEDDGPLAQMAVVLRASKTQGLFGRVLTRPVGWLTEESPANAWPEATPRSPAPMLAHEALGLARQMRDAEIELDDPEGILEPLESLVRGHFVALGVPGLPGLAEVVRGETGGWPAASANEVSAEAARREVIKARDAGVPVALDSEVADVLRMSAARPALDRDLLPPQRIPVARYRATQVGLVNASDVGTGKAVMTLVACRGKATELEGYRLCLVLPKYQRSEWIEEEFPKFWPGVALHVPEGNRIANGLIAFDRELGPAPGVVIATFDQVRMLVEQLRVLTYDDLVVEEGDEALANPGTQIARAMWRLRDRAKAAFVLTATPRGKSNEEIDAAMAFARSDPEALRRRPLSRRYSTFDDVSHRRLRRAMGPAMVGVTREEMKDHMPALEEPEFKIIDPSGPERALLDAAEIRIASLYGELRQQVERAALLRPDDTELETLKGRMASTRGFLVSATEVALLAASDAEALRSSKAVAAALLESEGLIDAVVRTKSTKRTWIAGTVAAAAAEGEQTLAFAESVQLLRLLSRELAEVHGVEAPVYAGGIGEREASLLRRSFRCGELRVLLLSPVGRRGLNLPASLVAHYDLPWTPRPLIQRIGRATRTGSKHTSVASVLPVMKGTPDEHRAAVLIPRAAETDGVLRHGEDPHGSPDSAPGAGLAGQLGEIAGELAGREGASIQMKVAAQIFASRREAALLAA